MEIRRLGRSGLDVTALGIGTATFGAGTDATESHAILDRAFAAGIRLIDTADFYPSIPELAGTSERIVGEWLRARGSRAEAIIATKVNSPMSSALNSGGLGRKHLAEGALASLERLGVENIDLLQAHRPDPATPLEETIAAFDQLIRQGVIHYYGICNWPVWMVVKACAIADARGYARPIAAQYPYNPVMRDLERESVEACRVEGIGLLTINALAGGLLTGRYRNDQQGGDGRFFFDGVGARGNSLGETYRRRYWSPAHFAAVDRLESIGAEAGVGAIPAAIAWVRDKPEVASVLLGASSLAQLESQLPAAALRLEPEVAARIDELWWDIPRSFTW